MTPRDLGSSRIGPSASRPGTASGARRTGQARRPLTATGVAVVVCVLSMLGTSCAHAQRAGASTTVRAGTVTNMRVVDLKDGSALGGAVVGGALGAALSGSSTSSRRRNRNAAIGALLGGAAASSKRSRGRMYTVRATDGAMIQVTTEQTEIRIGDCVYVEQSSRNSTNIRRAPATACEPETREVLQDPVVARELQQDAAVCLAAKQELADAEDDEAFDRAARKVKILCYD